MKRINFLLVLSILFAFSCNKDNLETTPETVDSKKALKSTSCRISGASSVNPGDRFYYTYYSDFTARDITWSVISGDISIASGQGSKTVILDFGENFDGGSIRALGSDGKYIDCSDVYSISKIIPCVPPTKLVSRQLSGMCPDDIFTIEAEALGASKVGDYKWRVTGDAKIISGENTNTIKFRRYSNDYYLTVTHYNNCEETVLSKRVGVLYRLDCDL